MSLYRIEFRRDTAANWASVNPVLAEGEPGLELDTFQFKLGDGASAWLDLPYTGNGTGGAGAVSSGTVRYDQLPVGTAPNTVAAGDDPRFQQSHNPVGPAGGVLAGQYPNPGLATGYRTVAPSFSYAGPIGVGSTTFRWYNDYGRSLTPQSVRVSLGTAPTGANAIFDVLDTGVSLFAGTSARPTVIAGSNTGTLVVPAGALLSPGDYLSVDIVQIGSSYAGANLTLTVVMS